MKWLKGIAVVVGVLIAVAAILPFFVTLNDYIPQIEKELSARVGEPVSIDNLYAALLPTPHARAEGITIGTAEGLHVGKVTLNPDVWSLAKSQKVIRTVDLEDVTLTEHALGALAALTKGDRSAGAVRVEKVRVANAVVKLERTRFGPFDMDVRVSTATEPGLLTLKTRDGALSARMIPEAEQSKIEISARKWTPPMGPAFVFDELEVKGRVRGNDAQFGSVDAKLYGGTATGAVTIAWDKGVSVKGNRDMKQIELQQPVALLSPSTRVSGRLDAKPVFSSHAPKADQLDDGLRVESGFTVHKGVLHGIDLAASAASLGKQNRGGQTKFDEFAGQLLLDKRSYRFADLRIASGGLAARGTVNISPSKALSGQLNTSPTALGRTVNVPLSVSGTLDAPVLLPNATAIAGALAGTAVLGPGVGTAAGAKLGEVVEGLFGGAKKKR